MSDWHPCLPGHVWDSGGLCGRCGLLDRDKATDPKATYSIVRKVDHAAMLADVNMLDRIVHALGVEDSHGDAIEKIAALKADLEDNMLNRGRLRLWMEFIQHNCLSAEAREYAGEALNGAHVPEGYDWDERSGRHDRP